MTRLSSLHHHLTYISSTNAKQYSTIRRIIPYVGLTTHFSDMATSTSAAASSSKSKPGTGTKPRDLSRELEEGIKPWIGPSVFSTIPSSQISPRSRSRQTSTQDEERSEYGQGQGQGTSSSPISISSAESSPVPTRRPRGVARYQSPLPATAFTPPRPQTSIHPFFQRTKSLPPPASQRPRLVAHYSSTESSSQQTETTDTQSTFGDTPSQPQVAERVVRPPVTVKGKGKEKAKTDERIPGYSDADIDAIANDIANVAIEASRVKPNAAPRTSTTSGLPKIKSNVHAPAIRDSNSGLSRTNKVYPNIKILPKPSGSTLPLPPTAPPSDRPPPSKPKPPFLTKPAKPVKLRYPQPEVDDPSIKYFKYSKLPNPPAVVYTTDPTEVNDLMGCLKGDVFGFDLEWPPMIKTWDADAKTFKFNQGKTALIQICDRGTILLIHMKTMTSLPEKLLDFIQDPNRFKLGVQIGGDGRKLMKDFTPALSRAVSLLELSKLARRIDGEEIGPGNTLISLTKLANLYLGFPLSKDPNIRSGNWAGTLNKEQMDYAANDVYASLLIYEKLMAMGQERSITVDRRSLCSVHGDYQAHIPRPTSPSGVRMPMMAKRNSTSPDPSPSQARTIAMFMDGKSTEDIRLEMGIKRSSVQSYLAEAIGRSHEDVLSDKDKRRFLDDIKDNFWISRNHGPVVAQVKAELGMVDGQATSHTVLEQIARGEAEEAAEETDTEQEVSEEEEVIEAEVDKKT